MSSTAASATTSKPSPTTIIWPWIPRDPKTDRPLSPKDMSVTGLPTPLTAKFDVSRIKKKTKDDTHPYNVFLGKYGKLSKIKLDTVKKGVAIDVGTMYHTLGKAIMEAKEEENWPQLAIMAFEQDYLISSKYLKADQTIAGLRQLSLCYQALEDWPMAVRFGEQALTNSIASNDAEEIQAAYVHLGRVVQAWLDTTVESGSFKDREELIKQLLHYFGRAHALALVLPSKIGEQHRREILVNAKINLSLAYSTQVAFASLLKAESMHCKELRIEIDEPVETYLNKKDFNRWRDVAALSTEGRKFKLAPVVPAEGRDSFAEAKALCEDAEALCFPSGKVPEFRELPPGKREIDELVIVKDGAAMIQQHADIRHDLGYFYECAGEYYYPRAIEEYVLSVRILNAYRNVARTSCKRFEIMMDGQFKSLQAACLLCVRLGHWARAKHLAAQIKELCRRSRECGESNRREFGGAIDWAELHTYDAKNLDILIKDSELLQSKIHALDDELGLVQGRLSDPVPFDEKIVTCEKYESLLRKKADLLRARIRKYEERQYDQDGNLTQTAREFLGREKQLLNNTEREMWNIIRQHRGYLMSTASVNSLAQHPQAAKIALLLKREGHLLIKLAQSVHSLSHMHLSRYLVPDREREVSRKYYLLLDGWYTLCEELLHESHPEWHGMILREMADQMDALDDDAAKIRAIRIKACEAFMKCQGKPEFDLTTAVRLEVINSVVESFDSLPTKDDTKQYWLKQHRETSEYWKQLSQNPRNRFWSVDRIAEVFEGEREWDGQFTEYHPATPFDSTGEDDADEAASAPVARRVNFINVADDDESEEGKEDDSSNAMSDVSPIFPPPSSKPIVPTKAAATTRPPPAPTATQRPSAASTSAATARPSTTTPPKVATSTASVPSSAAPTQPQPLKRLRKRIREDGSESQNEEEEAEDDILRMLDVPAPTAAMTDASATQPPRKRQHVGDENVPPPQQPTAVDLLPPSSAMVLGGKDFLNSGAAPPLAMIPSTRHSAHLLPSAPLVAHPLLTPSYAASLATYTIHDQGAEELVVEIRKLKKDIGAIRHLKLTANRFTHTAMLELIELCKDCTSVVNAVTQQPAPLSLVQTLDLSFSTLDKPSWGDWSYLLTHLRRLPRLQTLIWQASEIGDWCPTHIERGLVKCTKLTSLILDDSMYFRGVVKAQDQMVRTKLGEALTVHKSLQELSVRGCPLAPCALVNLLNGCKSINQLQILALSYAQDMSYQYHYSPDHSSTEPLSEDREGSLSEQSMLQGWRERRQTSLLIGPTDLEKLKKVYQALEELCTHRPIEQPQRPKLFLKLSGWSNVSSQLSTALCRILMSPTCIISSLELLDADFTPDQLTQLSQAIQTNHTTSGTFQRLIIRPFDETLCSTRVMQQTLESLKKQPGFILQHSNQA